MAITPWPNSAKAAISFTMDNLGEPLEIQLGQWPKEGPFGTHEGVTKYLPKVLDDLDEFKIQGTYFVEAWSLGIYGPAVKELMRRGHEVAWHAYQHEHWRKLSPAEQEDNFARSVKAAAECSIKYKGFRPPGGSITETTRELLRHHNFEYVSYVAPGVAIEQGTVILPFQWKDIDAIYYSPELDFLRRKLDMQEEVLEPVALKKHLLERIQETKSAKGHLAVLFHPHLQVSEEKRAVMRDILHRISSDPEIWCAPCDQVAEWVKGHPESFPSM